MPKIAIISYNTLNKGDEIQSLATKELVERLGYTVDLTIDREGLKDFKSDETIKLICNGWFMEEPHNWPPSASIDPLFISMHISHEFNSIEQLAHPKHLSYYKKCNPIGCRDYHTLAVLEAAGIPAYFSGCMTLTYQNEHRTRTNNIVLADPLYRLRPLRYQKFIAEHWIPKNERKNIVWTTHWRNSRHYTQPDRIADTEKLIECYATAKLVITSRMHAALTCVALNTPVLFVDAGYHSNASKNRFDGLLDHVRILDVTKLPWSKKNLGHVIARCLGLYKLAKKVEPLNMDWNNPPQNPSVTKPIAENIEKIVAEFLK